VSNQKCEANVILQLVCTSATGGIMHSEFIVFGQRRLFLLSNEPPSHHQIATVFLPAFAEEMNKTRHLVSQCRQQLHKAGLSLFQLDAFGTGDSEGDLDQTGVLQWRDDLIGLLQLLQQRGYQAVNFIAMRFGALQLFDLLAQPQTLPLQLHKVVLWQPFMQSSQFLQQLFRLKVAEQMAVGEKTSQKIMEQQLADGELLEIAGYPLTANFVDSVRQLRDITAFASAPTNKPPLLYLETSNLSTVSPLTEKSLAQLADFFDVNFQLINDAPYWTATELLINTVLVEQTVRFLQEQS